ncbi:MAG: hypothetical protein HYW63_02020 [Candidatus Levybacteria bacterium]|nr:hypothetical protein [Candidatus Levybacteria bacterium]
MTNEMQPVRPASQRGEQAQGEQARLTGQNINPTLRSEGNIFMPDAATGIKVENPTTTEGKDTPAEKATDDTPKFNGQGKDADSRTTLKVISEENSVPQDVREAARRELERAKETHRESIRKEWQKAKSEAKEGVLDDDSIEAAIEAGHGPDTHTSKLLTNLTARQVIENANLDRESEMTPQEAKELLERDKLSEKDQNEILEAHRERLDKAETLLGRKISVGQKLAILRAHYVGLGELGKNGKDAGVFNLKKDQIERRVVILEKAGFNKDQIRVLIESGLIAMGAPPPAPGTEQYYTQQIENVINDLDALLTPRAGHFTDTFVDDTSQQIHELYTVPRQERESARIWLDRHANEVYKYGSEHPGPAAREARELMGFIRRIASIDDIRLGREEQNERFRIEFDTLKADPGARDALVEKVIEYVASINPSHREIPSDILKRIIQTEDEGKSLERLVIRIVGTPLQSETGEYSLGFYGNINLESISNLLQAMSENPNLEGLQNLPRGEQRRVMDARYYQLQEVHTIKEGVRYIHELNKYTVTDQLENARQLGNQMPPEYLNKFQRLKGVGTVMRYLEWALSEVVSREGILNNENFNKLTGQVRNPDTGKYEVSQESSVFQSFRRYIDMLRSGRDINGAILSPNDLTELAGLEDWEIRLAYNIGRNLYNVEHRSVEWAAQGSPRPGYSMWKSPVMEGFARILNFGKWLNLRFALGEGRGGMVLFKHVIEVMQRLRRNKGYERNNPMTLDKIKGEDIAMFELANMTAPRGFWASWRAMGGLLEQFAAKFHIRPNTLISGYDVIHDKDVLNPQDTNLAFILDFQALSLKRGNEDPIKWDKATDEMKMDYLRAVFLNPENPAQLRPDLRIGLGAILRIALTPEGGKKHRELDSLRETIRTKIWERVAEDNPLAVAPYLHGLKYKGGRTVDIYNHNPNVNWLEFSRKLAYLNEIRLAHIRGYRDPATGRIVASINYTLQDAINSVRNATQGRPDASLYNLTGAENDLLQHITLEGRTAAADLANVEFPFIPFLNDILFERADYDEPGAQAVGRHFNDLAQIHGSNQASADMLVFPAQFIQKDPNATVEAFKKFEQGITAVHGDKVGKARLYPFVESILWFHRRGENGGGRVRRFIRKQDEIHTILQKFRIPKIGYNSVAQQELKSYKPETLDLGQVFDYIDLLSAEGLMGEDEQDEAKKRLGGAGRFGWLFILRMIWEGVQRGTKAGAVIGGAELLKRSFNPKGAVE